MRSSALAVLIVWTALAVTASAGSPITPAPPVFSGQVPFAAGDYPTGLAIADVNGDRKPDVLTSNGGAKTISVLVNDGRGRLQPPRAYPTTTDGQPQSLAVADVNGDGRRDILTADPPHGRCLEKWCPHGASGSVGVLLNGKGGRFRLVWYSDDASTSGFPLGTGDLNGDGHVDFATAMPFIPRVWCCDVNWGVSLFLNDGTGSFKKVERNCAIFSPGDPHPSTAAIGDLNGDGKQDVVTGNYRHITVIINDGDWTNCGYAGGSYATGAGDRTYWPQPGLRSLALADLNGDGKQDVVTAASEVDAVSVLLNKGGGRFADHIDYPTDDQPWTVAVGDLNSDHRLDLVTANRAAGTLSVLTGRGDGTFEARTEYATNSSRPWSVAIGDLNDDGRPDLVTTNADNDSVSVFLNRTTVCRVPNVKGKTVADARRALAGAHCRAGTIRHARSKAAAKGRVVSQRPAPGAVLQAGGRVNLSIGSSK